jgi:hypothetical protein
VNVTGLSITLATGVTYQVSAVVGFSAVTTTVGLKLGLTFPAAAFASFQVWIPTAADGTGMAFGGNINSSGDSVVATTSPANTGDFAAVIQGTIRTTGAGALQVQGAAEVSTTNGITVKGFSNMKAQAC